ncbi:MAG TPA: Glu/Leu/Phe/Val dehydrogenase dimerization domain-containing protein [Ktedonobacteraceae bacterium]|nr:Glu/Leu/Phe/Val dehydrogenase dimerization domain-containing protein [Ktedonobacteraceae bacterium]
MDSYIFDLMESQDYENIFFCQEKTLGLKAIIAIHDTTLGPAAGGIRMWPYDSEAEAIQDVLRLARGMTYKCAAAGASYGGGKCVVIGDPKRDKTEARLRALGRFINRLNGLFLTGVDVGTTPDDMLVIRQETPYVVTVPQAWGGPGDGSRATAYGVVQGIRACLNEVYDSPDLQGRTIALQGIGAVGSHALKYLIEAGAIVTIADVDVDRARALASQYEASIVSTEEIHSLRVDVYCPCALGNVLNDRTITELRCKIVCGSANNQLGDSCHGDALQKRGILYAPDYIVNAGGLLSNLDSLNPGGFNEQRAMEQVSRLYSSMENIIAISKEHNIPTYQAADVLAEQRIATFRQLKSLASGNERQREN